MRKLICSVIAVTLGMLMGAARGNTLLPGTTVTPDLFADETGTVVGSASGTYTSANFSGHFTELVLQQVSGTLDFVYQFSEASSIDGIGRITVTNFVGYSVDAGVSALLFGSAIGPEGPTVGITPPFIDRASNGSTIGFQFAVNNVTAFQPGTATSVLVLKTDATTMAPNKINFIDGDITQVNAIGPGPLNGPNPTPLPSTAGLGLLLLGGLGIGRVRRLNLA